MFSRQTILICLVGVAGAALLPHQTREQVLQARTNKGKAGDPWVNPCDDNMPLHGTTACDTTKPIDERVDALIKLLSNTDKVALLSNTAGSVSSLGVPAYQWWSEALHGVGDSPGVTFAPPTPYATSFPQVITTSCSFNTTLFELIGDAVGTEARAFHNMGHAGLTFWAPNINIFRDPRWGRGQETPGEDPTLSSDYSGHFPLGMQGGESWPQYIKASSCCKHFAAYSLENWGGVDRHHFNAVVNDQDLWDTYYPAFQSCVQRSSASGFMCSYNAINGVPSCAKADMLTGTLRHDWGFDGYVTSDCGAVDDVYYTHNYAPTQDDTCVDTLTAGMDSDCGGFLTSNLGNCLTDGVCNASVTDPALHHLFRVQMRLGLYDPASMQPYAKLDTTSINTPAHQQLALEASRQGIVLLKNVHKRLPLSTTLKVAIVGPNFDATNTMQGNYYGDAPYLISPIDGISKFVTPVSSKGCDVPCNDDSRFAAAATVVQSADVAIVVIGLDGSQENEGHDRTNISLPGLQQAFIQEMCEASGSPIVLVVMSGGSVDLSQAKNNNTCVGAIIWAGYPGQSGGQALAEIIFGVVNPSGRLTQTFYPDNFTNQVSLFDMGMRPNTTSGNPGRTHRFYTGPSVFVFGDGLSFSEFTYSFNSNNHVLTSAVLFASVRELVETSARDAFSGLKTVLSLPLTVCNSEEMDGDHVILVFASSSQAGQGSVPLQTLAAYTRVHVRNADCMSTLVDVPARAFALADEKGKLTTVAGSWTLRVGQPTQLIHTVELV
eukprot:c10060_g1_i1.p1 GENE.c10060_g1_i1~~c10060_g1_i1.p1  ORF type:complete len:775 (-),score=214.74 c10060_g1_i1:125-2449(-)